MRRYLLNPKHVGGHDTCSVDVKPSVADGRLVNGVLNLILSSFPLMYIRFSKHYNILELTLQLSTRIPPADVRTLDCLQDAYKQLLRLSYAIDLVYTLYRTLCGLTSEGLSSISRIRGFPVTRSL